MTKILEEAIKKIREMSEADQQEAAAMLLSVVSKGKNLIKLDEGPGAAWRVCE